MEIRCPTITSLCQLNLVNVDTIITILDNDPEMNIPGLGRHVLASGHLDNRKISEHAHREILGFTWKESGHRLLVILDPEHPEEGECKNACPRE